MRLVLVHGINHQGLSSNWIIDEWLGALKTAVSPAEFSVLKRREIVAPFYGDVLHAETQHSSASGADAVPMSVGQSQDGELEFMGFALQEAASALGISEAQILASNPSDEALEQGFPHDRRIIALASALESLSPFQGRILLRVLSQAYVYLRKPQARKKVDDIVRPAIADGPCVIVGHSLGSVVTFNLLREESGPQIPFYMTIGSPLAIKSVQSALGRPQRRPTRVNRWLNGGDRNDFITLGRILDSSTFGPGVENERVDNGPEPHNSKMYLQNKTLSNSLVMAFET